MKKILFLILAFATPVCLLFPSDLDKKYTFSELYDLNFKIVKDSTTVTNYFFPWRVNGAYAFSNFYFPSRKDSVYTLSYKNPMPTNKRLEVEMEQRILLPTHQATTGQVIFEGKGEALSGSYLVIDGLNYREECINSDTLSLPLVETLGKYALNISLKDAELLNLKFHIEGESETDAWVGFHKLNIRIGDKDIDSYSPRTAEATFDPGKWTPIDLANNDAFKNIEAIQNKKIIALGEAMHRNYSINKLASTFIEQQIKKGNCKLVLIEYPFERILLFNNYVIGKEVDLKSKDGYQEFCGVLETIRAYNKDKNEQDMVYLGGIDYNYFWDEQNNSFSDIFNYIVWLNDRLKRKELDYFALALLEEDKSKTFSFMQKNKDVLQSILPEKNYEAIDHILKLSYQTGLNKVNRMAMRDSVMYLNTKFWVSNYCPANSSTIIYAHSGHVNRISTHPAVPSLSLGYYLQKEFPTEYTALLLSVGQGSVLIKDQLSYFNKREISLPVPGSLEYQLSKLNEDVVYVPITSEYDRLIPVRFIASHEYPSEFLPFNLFRRYDGVLYINKCKDTREFINPMAKLMDKLKSGSKLTDEESELFNQEMLKPLKESGEKAERRKMKIKEIKERVEESL
ncbi:erythromycin esterase family protein [Bacteroides sp. 519]|uniref:erythromycin esterase family protein n=1 Tax=Bacteroides sp. 519 TaxID=2302937 RepID=UPI0013D3D246|nr:erythromycin esterase family protein [Bacteroides sp. 519]NDV57631.1 hypothetical protein [Bacteroides sp. 519]